MSIISTYRDRYPTKFVVPRQTRHTYRDRLFLPSDKIAEKYRGLALYWDRPFSDILHAWNRIPLGHPKYLMSFESNVPANLSAGAESSYFKFMLRELASARCRRLIGLSRYAVNRFHEAHRADPLYETLKAKLFYRHPNVTIPDMEDPLAEELSAGQSGPLVMTFLGGHFARKGGCVALRFAEEAYKRGWPVHINILSSMQMGGNIWTDPTRDAFFDPYRALLDRPNVTFFGPMANEDVLGKFAHSHFTLLPSFSDTFGYSIIEGMAHYTPPIATDIQAIPEFLKDGTNGIMLNVDRNVCGEWLCPPHNERGLSSYEAFFAEEIEKLVSQMLDRVEPYLEQPAKLLSLRKAARLTAETMFSPQTSAAFYDDFYDRVSAEKRSDVPVCQPEDICSPSVEQIDFSQIE